VGWGVLNWSNIEPMIAHLNGSSALPDRPGDVVTCMELNQEAREIYWGGYPASKPIIGQTTGLAVVEKD